MTDKKLVCIGTAILDCIVKGLNEEPVSKGRYVSAATTLNVGGEAVNEAITASKLGLDTSVLISLGNDTAGTIIKDALAEAGTDISLIITDPLHPTPITTMFVGKDGERRSITNLSHRHNFHPEIYTHLLEGADAITLGSLFRAPFDDIDVLSGLLTYAVSHGITVFADTKLPSFSHITLEDLKDILPMIDFIFPNEDEAAYYTGKDEPEEMADVLLSYGVRNAVIKLGAKGCLFRNKEQLIRLPAFSVEAVDATGAGDNFMAGFIESYLDGKCPEECLRFACACGAICTTEVGSVSALRDKDQVMEFLKNN